MTTISYKGYAAKIEFDPEDNILFGNIIGIRVFYPALKHRATFVRPL